MIYSFVRNIGQRTVRGFEELGYAVSLFVEIIYWLIAGRFLNQSVRFSAIVKEAMQIGVGAIPIAALLCFSVGVMLAIQGIETLKTYGAESKVVIGIALSVTREFSPLIVGILVAGRSGSAITARIGSMQEAQEIDALRVIGINPIRYLAAPLFVAMLIAVPCLTIIGDLMGIMGGAVYAAVDLNISIGVYMEQSLAALSVNDVVQGLIKSLVFATIIVLVGVINGFQVKGGAEGVGQATTRSVVMAISFIVIADMVFTYLLNH